MARLSPSSDGLSPLSMSTLSEAALQAALAGVIDPATGQPLVGPKALRNLRIAGGEVAFDVEIGYPARSRHAEMREALAAAACTVPGVTAASAASTVLTRSRRRAPSPASWRPPNRHSPAPRGPVEAIRW